MNVLYVFMTLYGSSAPQPSRWLWRVPRRSLESESEPILSPGRGARDLAGIHTGAQEGGGSGLEFCGANHQKKCCFRGAGGAVHCAVTKRPDSRIVIKLALNYYFTEIEKRARP